MSLTAIPNVTSGGVAVPLGRNMFFMRGKKHKDGGIVIGDKRKGIEVEDGEVVKLDQHNTKVFSSMPLLAGNSPASLILNGANPQRVFRAQEQFKDRVGLKDDGTNKYKDGGEEEGYGWADAAKDAAGFVPVLGTLVDAYDFYKNPSWENAGWLLASAASDLVGARTAVRGLRMAAKGAKMVGRGVKAGAVALRSVPRLAVGAVQATHPSRSLRVAARAVMERNVPALAFETSFNNNLVRNTLARGLAPQLANSSGLVRTGLNVVGNGLLQAVSPIDAAFQTGQTLKDMWTANSQNNKTNTKEPKKYAAGGKGHISNRGVNLIGTFEGFMPRIYKDSGGVETIGYGETDRDFINRYRGRQISRAEATQQLRNRAQWFYDQVANKTVGWDKLNQDQRDVLTSYAYNIGVSGYQRHKRLLAAIAAGDYNLAAKNINAGMNDARNPGLRKRRLKEQFIFTNGYGGDLFNSYNKIHTNGDTKGFVKPTPVVPTANNLNEGFMTNVVPKPDPMLKDFEDLERLRYMGGALPQFKAGGKVKHENEMLLWGKYGDRQYDARYKDKDVTYTTFAGDIRRSYTVPAGKTLREVLLADRKRTDNEAKAKRDAEQKAYNKKSWWGKTGHNIAKGAESVVNFLLPESDNTSINITKQGTIVGHRGNAAYDPIANNFVGGAVASPVFKLAGKALRPVGKYIAKKASPVISRVGKAVSNLVKRTPKPLAENNTLLNRAKNVVTRASNTVVEGDGTKINRSVGALDKGRAKFGSRTNPRIIDAKAKRIDRLMGNLTPNIRGRQTPERFSTFLAKADKAIRDKAKREAEANARREIRFFNRVMNQRPEFSIKGYINDTKAWISSKYHEGKAVDRVKNKFIGAAKKANAGEANSAIIPSRANVETYINKYNRVHGTNVSPARVFDRVKDNFHSTYSNMANPKGILSRSTNWVGDKLSNAPGAYINSWKNHPIATGLTHLATIGGGIYSVIAGNSNPDTTPHDAVLVKPSTTNGPAVINTPPNQQEGVPADSTQTPNVTIQAPEDTPQNNNVPNVVVENPNTQNNNTGGNTVGNSNSSETVTPTNTNTGNNKSGTSTTPANKQTNTNTKLVNNTQHSNNTGSTNNVAPTNNTNAKPTTQQPVNTPSVNNVSPNTNTASTPTNNPNPNNNTSAAVQHEVNDGKPIYEVKSNKPQLNTDNSGDKANPKFIDKLFPNVDNKQNANDTNSNTHMPTTQGTNKGIAVGLDGKVRLINTNSDSPYVPIRTVTTDIAQRKGKYVNGNPVFNKDKKTGDYVFYKDKNGNLIKSNKFNFTDSEYALNPNYYSQENRNEIGAASIAADINMREQMKNAKYRDLDGKTIDANYKPTSVPLNPSKKSLWQRFKELDDGTKSDIVGIGSNVISGVSGYLNNRHMLNSLQEPAAPVLNQAAKLKTTVNINPQLDTVDRGVQSAVRDSNENTASSNVAASRNMAAALYGVASKNQLYGNKENAETELINKDKLNQQEVARANAEAYNNYTNNVINFRNTVADKRAENFNGLLNTVNSAVQDAITKREQRTNFRNSVKASLVSNPDSALLMANAFPKLLPTDFMNELQKRQTEIEENRKKVLAAQIETLKAQQDAYGRFRPVTQ